MSATAPAFELVVITGLSGAGTTEAMKCFEDMGYFVMDNLPPSVIVQVAELCRSSEIARAAVVVRPSVREFFQGVFQELTDALNKLRDRAVDPRIVFLEATDEALVRRYESLRRPHPLAPRERIKDGIVRERQLLGALRSDAEMVIDTSALTPHELRRRLREAFPEQAGLTGLQVNVVSFGYKHGLPGDADLVLDTRFLPNPHWVPSLRALPGTDDRVRDYVVGQRETGEYLDHIQAMLQFLLPRFVREGKHYLTVAVGCTGGRHRSVVISQLVARCIKDLGFAASVHHRDLERG